MAKSFWGDPLQPGENAIFDPAGWLYESISGKSIDEQVHGTPPDPQAGAKKALNYIDWANSGNGVPPLPPSATTGLYAGIQLPNQQPYVPGSYNPTTITYGAQPNAMQPLRQQPLLASYTGSPMAARDSGVPSYTRALSPPNANSINIPGLTATNFGGGPTLGYGTPLQLQGMGPVSTVRAPTIGPAGAMQVQRIGSAGAVPVSRMATPGAVSVERMANMGPVSVERMAPVTQIGVERLGQAANRAVERVDMRTIGERQFRDAALLAAPTVTRVGNVAPAAVERLNATNAAYQMMDPRSLGLTSEWGEQFDLDSLPVDAQNEALTYMRGLVSGTGWDPVSEANFQRQTAQAETRRRGAAQGIVRSAELQGMGGSGIDILAQLQSGQSAISDQYLAALDAAALGAQRKDAASANMASAGATMRAQQFTEAAQRANAMDAYDLWIAGQTLSASEINTGRRLGIDQTNQGATNAANMAAFGHRSASAMADAAAWNASSQSHYQGSMQAEMFNANAFNQANSETYQMRGAVALQNAAEQNQAFAQQYALQGNYNLANASAQNAAYLQQAANIQQANAINAQAQNAAYSQEYGTNAQIGLSNQAAQNNAYSQQYSAVQNANQFNAGAQNNAYNLQYGTQANYNLANAAAQNNAYSQQYGLQGQYNLANASNALTAGTFNAGAQNQASMFNANASNTAATNNWQRQGTVDSHNNQNTYNTGLANWNNQNQVNQYNTTNAFNAALFSAGAQNTAVQFNTGEANAAAKYNAGLSQQAFNNQLNLQAARQSEQQFYAGLLAGQVKPGTPGIAQRAGEVTSVIGSFLG